jgi:cation diffusion facilitator CzcD-associated flavoprotein CzcO
MEEASMTQAFAGSGDSGVRSNDEQPYEAQSHGLFSSEEGARYVRVVILGTGFSGLGMAIRLKQSGYEDFVVLERAADIGGTWRDNSYPGCACDIPSHLYSFSFALNPQWSRMYSPQPEIWDYLRRIAVRYDILPHIRWNSELREAVWSEDDQRWHITTAQELLTADVLILGNGPLSEPSLPTIKGIERFEGVLFHSAQWDHDVDLTGKRVAVIGTGASAVQFVPQIQPRVGHLTLFLRTPPWILPRMDHAIPAWKHTMFRLLPLTQHFARSRIYWRQELSALGLVYRPRMLEKAVTLAQRHLERQVSDPVLRATLTPTYAMGCKRILLSDDFYPVLSRPNVEVVSERVREVREKSIVTEDGSEREIDVIICGTGFHVTDAPLPQSIHGRGDITLAERWQGGQNAYLGTTVAGFPNLFLLIGPNTGLGHNSMVYMIESQFSYILDGLRKMDQQKLQAVDVRPEVQEAFNVEIQRRMEGTVWMSGCASWYLDASGRNTTIWPGFTFEYRHRTLHFDLQHYNMMPRRTVPPLEEPVAVGHESR